jgi:type VII secretion system (Wss) protein YukD
MSNEITVTIVTIGGDEHRVETPTDLKAEEFISELLTALKLPQVDAERVPIKWRLDNKDTGKSLAPDKTLEENEVRDGHHLNFIRATVAGGTDRIQLISRGKSLRQISGSSEENIYGLEDGYLLLPQVMLPLLRDHIEGDSTSKWFDRSIGFFLGACLGFILPAIDKNSSSTVRAALISASVISLIALIAIIILEHKVDARRKRIVVPLIERLSGIPKTQ